MVLGILLTVVGKAQKRGPEGNQDSISGWITREQSHNPTICP